MGLKERNHEITVLTGKPNYPSGNFFSGYSFFTKSIDSYNGIKIYRSFLIPRKSGKGLNLAINYLSFFIFSSFRIFGIKERFDKIFVYEPSPVTVGIPAIVAKYRFKAPIYFWVQDLWPESISAAGGVKNKVAVYLTDQLTRFIYKHCYKILVQSTAFFDYIQNQNVAKEKLIYYPNSTEQFYNVETPEPAFKIKFPDGINILFAGNLGEAQSFDTILDAASIIKQRNIKLNFIILGDGRMSGYIKKRVLELQLENCVHLLGAYPSELMPKFFCCADALLVTLKKDNIFSMTIPSKLQSYMACGKPVIASLDGIGAEILKSAQAGFASPAEDVDALVKIILDFISIDEDAKNQLGKNARSYFEKHFERELLLTRLESILSEV
jgi:glycosyltransferase involved in cell wall biosynthesis